MSDWQPIETAKNGDTVITYYPALKNRRGQYTHARMMRIEMVPVCGTRKPTLWQPVPEEPPQ